MRRTKEDAELTRQALLAAALQTFSLQGYEAARLEDIAAAARVTRGAIYHHFSGKAGLFRALVEDASATGSQAVQRAINEGGDFLSIARRVLVYTLDLLRTDSAFRQVMALYLFQTGSAPELAEFQQQRLQAGYQMQAQVAGFFRIGLEQGAVRPDLDPSIAAIAFLAYQNGLVLHFLADPAAIPAGEEAAALADVLVRGIDGPGG